MTPAELIARARSAIGKGIKYKLGAGGLSPRSELPCNADGDCDCSGYSAWAIGLPRMTKHPLYLLYANKTRDTEYAWINTDSMYYDGFKRMSGYFELLQHARPGALILYPGEPKRKLVGHVGIVSAVADNKATEVIHCSSGNFRRGGDAIAETGPEVFYKQPKTVHLMFCGVEEA
jgi:hypothetical protein